MGVIVYWLVGAWSIGTISLPSGNKASPAILNDAIPNGIVMMKMHRITPVMT